MNEGHAALCSSPEWAAHIAEVVLPEALGGVPLDGEVLEIGPGYGATTEHLARVAPRLTVVELDERLVADLREQFPAVSRACVSRSAAGAAAAGPGRAARRSRSPRRPRRARPGRRPGRLPGRARRPGPAGSWPPTRRRACRPVARPARRAARRPPARCARRR